MHLLVLRKKTTHEAVQWERVLFHVFFMMKIINFLIAIVENTADIRWPTEFITAVLMHLSQALFSTELGKI